jgi:hypothetical protein
VASTFKAPEDSFICLTWPAEVTRLIERYRETGPFDFLSTEGYSNKVFPATWFHRRSGL